MNAIQKTVMTTATSIVLFGYLWRTLAGAGVGAVAGVDTIVGVVGGAVMGGFVGYEICKEHLSPPLEQESISVK